MLTIGPRIVLAALLAVMLTLGCTLTEATKAPGAPYAAGEAPKPLLTVDGNVLQDIVFAGLGIVAGWLGLRRPGDIARPSKCVSSSQ